MSQVQGRPSRTMSTERRYGIAISVALILGGIYWALTGLTEDTKTSQDSYPVGDSLTVESRSADIEVRAGDGPEIKVERQIERNVFGSDPKESYETYKLDTDTSSGDESTDEIKTDPASTRTIKAKTSSGDVTIEYNR